MTHTIADAEDAIRRYPECLVTLSMAADLLIEQGDRRGEDFSLCLQGGVTGEELMRRHPADVSAMFVAAWRLAGADVTGACGRARCDVRFDGPQGWCPLCRGSGVESNGNAARAEALRLLAECGKAGMIDAVEGWYFYWSIPDRPDGERVCSGWWHATRGTRESGEHQLLKDTVSARLALLDAYAAADPDTRRRWAEETRAMGGAAV